MKKYYDPVTGHTYTVIPVITNKSIPLKIILTCVLHYGPQGLRWFYRSGKLFFRDEQDVTLYLLRWS
jgi:hypothetical protein